MKLPDPSQRMFPKRIRRPLRMLTTLLAPTRGEATVAGIDLRRNPGGVRRRIGYVAQSGSTSGAARAGEEVIDHALLYGVPRSVAAARGRCEVGEC